MENYTNYKEGFNRLDTIRIETNNTIEEVNVWIDEYNDIQFQIEVFEDKELKLSYWTKTTHINCFCLNDLFQADNQSHSVLINGMAWKGDYIPSHSAQMDVLNNLINIINKWRIKCEMGGSK
ncbi:hypothetical protein [uncultured phage_MedDCM-OCT-S28-C10]|uniref:Uncharacterized protein n=1 Tax=uncultured phage_MedDCM-OCT-S28-C10 TaxID=2741077 RepID=A0A6S4P9J9_9CAUD|nr:hypothetical protein HOQ60_gp22 [uncultured phage_MedDCM-OCT-S28-C10]BAQ94065.1 hypothetical protein [uncultured phage_MedDCM-OCT-S28-C10]